jgi:hypothetical protein
LENTSRLFAKKKWLEFLNKFSDLRIIDRNVTVADCHYNVSGNIDIILNIGGKIFITKIQPVNHDDFAQVKEKGAFKKHVIEMIVYMWLSETNDGLLLYDNQNTNCYRIFHIKGYSPVIKSVMKKCLELLEYKIQGRIPNRPYKSTGVEECNLCEFKKECWREKNDDEKAK